MNPKEGRAGAQVIPIEQSGELRPFVSLEDLERLAAEGQEGVTWALGVARIVWDSVKDNPGLVYVLHDRRPS